MDSQSALSFGASAPFIAMVIAYARTFVDIPAKLIPVIVLGLAFAWGGVLWVSDLWSGNAAVFIVTGFLVATAASGIREWTNTAKGA